MNTGSFSHLNNEEETEAIQEARKIAQAQFIDLSNRYTEQQRQLQHVHESGIRLRLAYASARNRAEELSRLLTEETQS